MNPSAVRKIALDIETTGIDWKRGDRIIEIAGVEISAVQSAPKTFHAVINPECEIDESGTAIHGYTQIDLCDRPVFSGIAADFLAFVQGAELIMHNANFDVGFLNAELARSSFPSIDSYCKITCMLAITRQLFPSQSNSLDVLCERFGVHLPPARSAAVRDAALIAAIYRTSMPSAE